MRCALVLGLVACGSTPQPIDAATEDASVDAKLAGKVLLFSRTAGFRHGPQIDLALERLPPRLEALGLTWSSTEQPLAASDLAGVRAVFFLYTTGDVVADRAAFESFIRGGGAFIGLHSATDTEYSWPFYQELVVAAFLDHPPSYETAAMDILDPQHPALAHLPARWVASDEWYNFRSNPGAVAGVQVLANLDETTYTGGSMGAMHPIVWSHEKLGGRAIYSAAGHPEQRWDEPAFVDHVVGMVSWALR